MLACSIAAKALSYVWESTLAAYLGASDDADCFYMMLSIFNILYPILDIGIWKVFMPIYKTKLAKNENENANKMANISMAFFSCLSLLLVAVFLAFAEPLTVLIANGFSPEKKHMTAMFIRVASPLYITMAASSVLGAILQSHEKFFGSQLREIGAHVSKILFLIVCYRFFGIYAAVFAYIVGSVFRVIVQLPFIDWKWKFRFDFHFKDKNILTMIKGLPSVAITSAVSHVNSLIDRMFASGAPTGSVSCLNYGNKLMSVFSGTISTAIGTATYPTIIQYVAENKEDQLRTLIDKIVNVISYIIIPVSAYCAFFSTELVTIAFQRGAFDASATTLTAQVFVGYSVGMLFIGLRTIISNVYYAFGDTKITMYITLFGIALNIGLNFVLFSVCGVPGLAYATSISAFISHFVRLALIRRFVRLDYRKMAWETAKTIIISLIAIGIPCLIFKLLIQINVYLCVVISGAISVLLFIGLSKLFHIKTQDYVVQMIKKKLSGGSKTRVTDNGKDD